MEVAHCCPRGCRLAAAPSDTRMPTPYQALSAVHAVSSTSALARPNMSCGLLAVVLIGFALLGGCTEGVLDHKGPIAATYRQILLNSLGIMLPIVIPVL